MRLLSIVFALLLLAGCSGNYGIRYESEPTEQSKPEVAHHSDLHIPPGHFPPPGQCRVWVPGTPPGRQASPGDCATLAQQVPAGAWLLTRPADGSKYVEVSVYDEKKPGVIIEVQIYTADKGEFVAMKSGD